MSPLNLSGLRVAVTGGAGFIGSHLVRALLAVGADVTVVAPDLARRPLPLHADDEPGRVRGRQLDPLAPSTSPTELESVLSGAQALVHLDYRPPARGSSDPEAHESTYNLAGLQRLLASLPESARHVVFASSVMVYGPHPPVPVSEEVAPHPSTPYGRLKQRSEELLAAWAEHGGRLATSLRFSTVYGRGETVPRAVPSFIRAALAGQAPTIHGSGDDVRDYVHVSDVSRGILLALDREGEAPDVFNVASGIGRSTREVAELVLDLTHSPQAPVHLVRETPTSRIVCDVERARTAIGYRAAVDFPSGVEDEIAWFASHPALWAHGDRAPARAHADR
jgi:nucleoside-diphosphate-sugar epimerase